MKKIKALKYIPTALGVGGVIASTISCGTGTNQTNGNNNSNTNSSTNGGHKSIGSSLKAWNIDDLQIENKVVKHYQQSEITSTIWNALALDKSNIADKTWDDDWFEYSFTLPGTKHKIAFSYQQSTHIEDNDAKLFIKKWVENANYGYGALTLEHVFFSDKRITLNNREALGVGGQFKDLLISMRDKRNYAAFDFNDYSPFNPKQINNACANYQITYDTLLHEYGHHETLAFSNDTGVTEANNLATNNILGGEMYKNTLVDPAAEDKRLIDLFTSYINPTATSDDVIDIERTFLKTYKGKQIPWHDGGAGYDNSIIQTSIDNLFYFKTYQNAAAAQLPSLMAAEFLNRTMNNFEVTPWDDSYPETIYTFPEFYRYQVSDISILPASSRAPLFDKDNGRFSAKAKEIINLYAKYVYQYNSYGLQISKNNIKGFSKTDFDFVVTEDDNNKEVITKIDKIASHYITKDVVLDAPTVLDAPEAINGEIKNSSHIKNAHFFVDTNKNGVKDPSDQEVDVDYKIN